MKLRGYTIPPDGRWIYCWGCGLTSYNLNDVANRYCGHCGVFHDDLNPNLTTGSGTTMELDKDGEL